ncbi:GNAT family N-acetyltransferase [Actinokineospora spheciospongiae]|uniref:GNAT family N-acetyltransferase n=1 Tax=Actinokineospora spheciospongiae TaxID=909613 RepID=UPI000D9CEA77|nr:GNAT family N-acetyltransferase [Actinokineospora spheciospongiae]PWW65259.1 ribosomal protein S18 acetylase RimI-like enzyme [Actinokineospora spheciospongiae]
MDSAAEQLGRIGRFEHGFARVQATEVVDFPWGYALLQADYPASWTHNRVVVTGSVAAEEVIGVADEVLGGAGLRHRQVQFDDAGAGAAAAGAFGRAGYRNHERIVTMVHDGPLPEGDRALVEAVDFEDLRPWLIRDWRADFPDDPDHEIEQLADRVRLYERGAEVTFLAVRGRGGRVLARGELYRRDGVAQFENLITLPDSRGRGYGRALVAEALHRSADDDVRYLIAEATGWPRRWYRRLGYVDRTEVHVFQRTPGSQAVS